MKRYINKIKNTVTFKLKTIQIAHYIELLKQENLILHESKNKI